MIRQIINRYKQLRTNFFLSQKYRHNYAFIGMGQHSLSNLYPVLQYLQLPLKYICVSSQRKADLIQEKYHSIKATTHIDDILGDKSIKGVFVSTSPTAHFKIATQILQSNKALFIEKPPCQSLNHLHTLIDLQRVYNNTIVVGLQKRYAPAIQILKKRLNKDTIISYNLRYLTGAYPEGNTLIDLFIHPLDIAIFLFGEAKIIACEKFSNNSYLLFLKHRNVIGNLELSTNYSWNNAQESISICSKSGIYELSQMDSLTYTPLQRPLFNIPFEKVWKKNKTTEYLYSNTNLSPILVNNQIYSQGFYNEITTFINDVENNTDNSQSTLDNLISTYNLITEIQNK